MPEQATFQASRGAENKAWDDLCKICHDREFAAAGATDRDFLRAHDASVMANAARQAVVSRHLTAVDALNRLQGTEATLGAFHFE